MTGALAGHFALAARKGERGAQLTLAFSFTEGPWSAGTVLPSFTVGLISKDTFKGAQRFAPQVLLNPVRWIMNISVIYPARPWLPHTLSLLAS